MRKKLLAENNNKHFKIYKIILNTIFKLLI